MAVAAGVGLVVMVVLLLGAAAAGLASTFGFGGGIDHASSAPALALDQADAKSNTFPWGQCTWFVAQHRRVTWSGDAADWITNAQAQGVATTSAPTVGAIVVYRRGDRYSAAHGHVGLVVAVAPRTYIVAEMNYMGLGRIDMRTVAWPDPDALGFIP